MTEPNSEPWSIKRVLAWATDDFKRRGNKSARLDAELLLSEALGFDRIKLIVEAERPLADDELGRYRALIKRRRASEPIAYILGRREFFALPIVVDRRVLIPRPDTEILVETALRGTRERHLYGRMLDLCTGSGCVAIAFAKERPTWRVTAVDVSPDAASVARENVQRAGVVHNVAVLEGDLFAALAEGAEFELITANPPYIPSAEIAGLDADVRDFEPRLALDGGADGLHVTRRLVGEAIRYLSPGGLLALEGGFDQAPAVAALLEASGFSQIARSKDLAGVDAWSAGAVRPNLGRVKKWTLLEQVTTPGGSRLSLAEHDGTYAIRVNGRELMSSRHSFSEEQLGVIACQALRPVRGARVLIGGLGLGFTLRAALSTLARDAQVVVAELLPEVVTWNRNAAYPLSCAALADPRTQLVLGDVARVIEQSQARFDAIMLDADNQTTSMNTAGNTRLYQAAGLAAVRRALKERGTAVYWSAGEEPAFVERFSKSGFDVEVRRVRRHPSSKASHFLLVGRRASEF